LYGLGPSERSAYIANLITWAAVGLVLLVVVVAVAILGSAKHHPTPIATDTTTTRATTVDAEATGALRRLLDRDVCAQAAASPDPAITWCSNITSLSVDAATHAVTLDLSRDWFPTNTIDISDSLSACDAVAVEYVHYSGSRPTTVSVTVNGVLKAGEHYQGGCQQY
jgi:hypothetical protein